MFLARISRFETIETIKHLGHWVAAHHAVAVSMLDTGFKHVDEVHALPLLCVLDVVLKFSRLSQQTVKPHVPRWLRLLPAVRDHRFFASAEALVMSWVHHRAVDGVCLASFLERYKTGRERHVACGICGFRFDSALRRDAHMDAHVTAGYTHLTSQMRCSNTSLGLFAGLEEKKRVQTARQRGLPTRPHSPIPVTPGEVSTTSCAVCGDVCVKTFNDVCNTFVYEQCRRDSDGALVHVECISTTFFRSEKKQKTIQE